MKSFERLVRQYTDADLDLTDEEIKRLEARCHELFTRRHRRLFILLLCGAPLPAIAAVFGARVLAPHIEAFTGWSMRWCKLTGGLGLLFIVTAIWIALLTMLYRIPLRRALHDLGHEVCLKCGYWLRDLPDAVTRCPECGEKRAERFNPAGGNASDVA